MLVKELSFYSAKDLHFTYTELKFKVHVLIQNFITFKLLKKFNLTYLRCNICLCKYDQSVALSVRINGIEEFSDRQKSLASLKVIWAPKYMKHVSWTNDHPGGHFPSRTVLLFNWKGTAETSNKNGSSAIKQK